MPAPVIYVWILEGPHGGLAVFTWPNPCKKHIRDTWTVDGALCLPPPGRLTLTRHKVNPKAGREPVADVLDIEEFLRQ